ncbi:DNA polymerase-3 subunit alpha [Desulfobaculum xiamenense]|uniref:DNA polymerase III subunit alpha n=1 Tax=Desulfobaculum xiamenense TaxID=995050 RepID=A0A846QMN5_9BACT|nr:DNA polymerase III subunit alpha [Desulfobaculum xiamenense]NJB68447.1 DNA polymerase-3 subunit alpha [Desulfobaculum xiamenense]
MSDFVHLHCHTEYSLLDGAIRLGDLCSKAIEYGMPSVAVTDHGNMFAAAKFYLEAKKQGVKPIIGSEVYVSRGPHTNFEGEDAKKRFHLVLLAQNLVGYHNLAKIVSEGYLRGFYYKPRVSREILKRYSEGIVALSACLQGEVVQDVLNEGMDKAIVTAREYEAIFPGRFYIELQANGLKEQDQANVLLRELAAHTNLPLVATNDCHYLTAADHEAHDILLCVQTNACVDDAKRFRIGTDKLYFRPPSEMEAAFADCPEAIENTARIAEQCNVEIRMGKYFFPVYDVPPGKSLDDQMCDMARDGLRERLKNMPYKVDEKVYWDRLEMELGVITEMGFPGYFLIVQDFINWAKRNRIPVGPGRGSAAGSIVAYSLRITNLDPLPYNLLFERFLNIERVSMPDIDVDFCERRRTEVIKYVGEKYGANAVAQITTFGTMKAKAVVRDVGRALGIAFPEVNEIAKLIPEDLKMTIDKALEMEPELRERMKADPRIAKLIDISRRLEGLHRHASTHAAGVVISDGPMWDYLPLYTGKKGETVAQYDMKHVEKVGLVKFDFLGLRTMTVIQDTVDIIAERGKEPPNLDTLALDDPETFDLYSRGDTDGIFQVESDGMRKYLRMLKPSCFEDIIAMLALYRPGPLSSGMVEEFIKRKHGEVPVVYPLPQLEPVLKDTYGVIVYQEQVMKIAQVVAGYSLGSADLLRRAMGKKNAEAMAEQRAFFNEGAAKLGVDAAKATEIFDLMEMFAAYGFNKSHSAAYALISYHTAYLKVHYPTEFMAAMITSEVSNTDKVLKYIAACRDLEIEVLPPDVNSSHRHFTVPADGQIRYGLAGVKNVGDEAIREIVDARAEKGPFKSMLDLCERVNLRKVTKRVLEHLIKAGAMDGFGVVRAAMFDALDRVVALAQKKAKDKNSGQMSLMAAAGMSMPSLPGTGIGTDGPPIEEWPDDEKLRFEKESLGFYLSSHPLLSFRHELARMRLPSLVQVADYAAGAEVRTAILVTARKEIITQKGGKMAFCEVEDLTGSGEAVMFPEAYAKYREILDMDQPLLFIGKVSDRDGGPQEEEGVPKRAKLITEELKILADALAGNQEPVLLVMEADTLDEGGRARLKDVLARHTGKIPVQMLVRVDDCECKLQLGPRYSVTPTREFWKDVESL